MSEASGLPGALGHVWEWQHDAACQDADPTLFFAAEGERGHSRTRREEAARSFCRRCPVTQQCLLHALSVQEAYGMWGGLSEGELRRRYPGGSPRPRRLAAVPPLPAP